MLFYTLLLYCFYLFFEALFVFRRRQGLGVLRVDGFAFWKIMRSHRLSWSAVILLWRRHDNLCMAVVSTKRHWFLGWWRNSFWTLSVRPKCFNRVCVFMPFFKFAYFKNFLIKFWVVFWTAVVTGSTWSWTFPRALSNWHIIFRIRVFLEDLPLILESSNNYVTLLNFYNSLCYLYKFLFKLRRIDLSHSTNLERLSNLFPDGIKLLVDVD
jgi:hypothetical protein